MDYETITYAVELRGSMSYKERLNNSSLDGYWAPCLKENQVEDTRSLVASLHLFRFFGEIDLEEVKKIMIWQHWVKPAMPENILDFAAAYPKKKFNRGPIVAIGRKAYGTDSPGYYCLKRANRIGKDRDFVSVCTCCDFERYMGHIYFAGVN